MSSHWEIAEIPCYLLAKRFEGCTLPLVRHGLSLDRVWQIWAELIVASICHQTNWERLHERVIEIVSEDLPQLMPCALRTMTPACFRRLFAEAMSADRIRSPERAKLLRELGSYAADWPDGYEQSWLRDDSITLAGPGGLYAWLGGTEVFSADPLQKKARVFVHGLLRHGLVSVTDPEHIAPAVDYHIMRLYMRTGRVVPTTNGVLDRVSEEQTARVEFVTALRKAVERAMSYTAAVAGVRIDELNSIEWQIARSFCLRREPRCELEPLSDKPIDRVVTDLSKSVGGSCPLVTECQATRDAGLRAIVDPHSIRPYY